ncbi:MAG: hypothetical protein RIR26_2110, partial [Pseudomonadota bacterium]
RAEKFAIRGQLNPGRWTEAGRVLPVHLNFSAGSGIVFYRQFLNSDEAKKQPPLSLMDLPVTLDNAKKMRRGDVVVLPVDAQVIAAVDGSFLRALGTTAKAVESIFGSSLAGHFQSSLRANLLIKSRFEIHMIKIAENQMRVRLFQMAEQASGAGASARVTAPAVYSLFPFSKWHLVDEFKKAESVAVTQPSSLRVPDIMKDMMSSQQSVLDAKSIVEPPSPQPVTDAREPSTELSELSRKVKLNADEMQRDTSQRMNGIVQALRRDLPALVADPEAELKKFVDQELLPDAQVSWSAARKNVKQFIADYVFHLDDPNGQFAFLQAVSGASVLVTAHQKLSALTKGRTSLLNFVVAERMAREAAAKGQRSVEKILSASGRSETTEASLKIKFASVAGVALSENWKRDTYSVEQEGVGSPSTDVNSLVRWRSQQSYNFGPASERLLQSSGTVSDVSSAPGKQSFYWYSFETESGSASTSAMERFLIRSLNVLGAVGRSLGVQTRYRGEAAGPLRGRLIVGLQANLLDSIFDPKVTSEDVLWTALAQVATSYDNTFGLPFLAFPVGTPAGIVGATQQSACESVSRQWGNYYCRYFSEVVVPAFRAARTARDSDRRNSFLESFFSKGFGANKVGAALLARALLQMALESKGRLAGNELVIFLQTRHGLSSAPEQNLDIKFGNSEGLAALDGLIPPW